MTQDPPTYVENPILSESQLGQGVFICVKLDPSLYGAVAPVGSLACYIDDAGIGHLFFKRTEERMSWVAVVASEE